MSDTFDFGQRLKQLRAARDLTQEGLAELVGCAVQTVRSFEYGRRRPSREMAQRIAEVLAIADHERAAFLRLARGAPAAQPAQPAAAPLPTPERTARPALPPPSEPLIGRQHELDRIRRMFIDDRRRLVTLTGAGGIGKTRLAAQAAIDLAPQFAQGAVFVELMSVAEAIHAPSAIAAALGFVLPATQPPIVALAALLRDYNILIVLDNLEHLLAQPDDQLIVLLTTLLHEAPAVALLTTSRARLRLQSEWVIEIDGLSLPAADAADAEHAAAVLLFLQRARQTGEAFALTPDNRAAVVHICRLLEGIPLAVELAAAWVRVLTPTEIAEALERSQEVLVTNARDVPERHRSLQAAFEHSWRLLNHEEQTALSHLAVLRGAFTREAAAAVLPDAGGQVLLVLASLIDKSLVHTRPAPDGTARYALHERIRQYAERYMQADEGAYAAACARHAAYYAGWMKAQEGRLQSAEQAQAIEAVDAAIDNIRAAWRWGVVHRDPAILNQICYPIGWFAEVHGLHRDVAAMYAAGHAALRPLLAAEPSHLVQRIYHLMYGMEGWHSLRFDPQKAISQMQASYAALQQIDDPEARFQVAIGVCYVVGSSGDLPQALKLLEACLADARAAAMPWGIATAETVRLLIGVLFGDFALVRRHLPTAEQHVYAVGDQRAISNVLHSRASLALHEGETAEAEAIYRECLELSLLRGDSFETARSYQGLGLVALERQAFAAATDALERSLQIARTISDRWLEAQALAGLGVLAGRQGDRARAQRLLCEATLLANHIPLPLALDILAAALPYSNTASALLAYLVKQPFVRIATRAAVSAAWEALDDTTRSAALQAAEAYGEAPPSALSGFIAT